MKNTCQPPVRIPRFSGYLRTADIPEACKADQSQTAREQCQSCTAWTQYTASIDGALGLAAQIVSNTVKDKSAARKIIFSIGSAYNAVAEVNERFLIAIEDINAGLPYAPMPHPDPLPPFPVPTGGDNVKDALEEAWRMIEPWLEKSISALPEDSPWIKVLRGITVALANMIADFEELFKKL